MAPRRTVGFRVGAVRRGGRHRQLLLACLLRAGCPGCAAAADHRPFAWCWPWRRVRRRCCCGIVRTSPSGALAAFCCAGRCSPLPIRPCKRPMKPTIICVPTLSAMGRFDFDAKRSYPEDVNELMDAFPGAWVNAHTSAGLGTDPDTERRAALQHRRLRLKTVWQRRPGGEHLRTALRQYLNWETRDPAAESVTEPISFLILPFLPAGAGHGRWHGCSGLWRAGLPVRRAAGEPGWSIRLLCCAGAAQLPQKLPVRRSLAVDAAAACALYMGASLSYDAALLALLLSDAGQLLTCQDGIGTADTAAVYTARLRVCQLAPSPTSTCCGWCCRWWSCARTTWKSQTQPRQWYAVGTLAGALLLTQTVELIRHRCCVIITAPSRRQGGSTVNGRWHSFCLC